jgi:hypothetical protein
MFASLATIAQEITSLDHLTSAEPSAADLRYRAEFWRAYAKREADSLTVDQYCRIQDNCDGMLSAAARMDQPAAPVVQLVTAKKSTAPKAPAKPKMVSAAEFWTLHTSAVDRIIAVHGARWKLTAPDHTVETRLPAKLCSYVGPLGGKITWRRDQRMPSAQYWPGGVLPAGIELANPGRDKADWATNGILERAEMARLEQIETDRRVTAENKAKREAEKAKADAEYAEYAAVNRIEAGRSDIVMYWKRQHGEAQNERFSYKYRGKPSKAIVARGHNRMAEARLAMMAELARWRATVAPSNVVPLREMAI